MKALLFGSLLFATLPVLALEGRQNVEKINQTAMAESLARKHEGELFLRKKQLETAHQKIVTLTNDYDQLFSKFRQVQSEKQYLLMQNDQLLEAIKNSGTTSPELAEKMKEYSGRMPASTESKK